MGKIFSVNFRQIPPFSLTIDPSLVKGGTYAIFLGKLRSLIFPNNKNKSEYIFMDDFMARHTKTGMFRPLYSSRSIYFVRKHKHG